jgi:photosystem II stability/assembly factor-like uncharacterized protein
MDEPLDLETIYEQAQAALGEDQEERALDLLKQILAVDEEYRDTAQLLAELVSRRRRRWFQDLRVWGGLGLLILVGAIIILRDPLSSWFSSPQPSETPTVAPITPSESSTTMLAPTVTSSPTPLTLYWRRISQGLSFTRDTILALVFDPQDPDVMYAGLNTAGIYKSINGGNSWGPTHNGLARTTIVSLAMDPEDSRVLYAGTAFSGPYRTTDGGDSWHPIQEGLDPSERTKLQVFLDPLERNHLYSAGGTNLYESFDRGESWSIIPRSGCPEGIGGLVFHPQVPQKLFSLGGCGDQISVNVSEDGGRSWISYMLEEGILVEQYWFLKISQTGEILYVAARLEGYGDQLYVSSDGGLTWIRTGLNDACRSLVIHPEHPWIASCITRSDGKLVRTEDVGRTWSVVNHEMSGLNNLFLRLEGSETLYGSGDGLFVSSDGGSTWAESGDGLGSGSLELTLDPADPSVFYVEDSSSRLFRSDDQGQNWDLISEEGARLAIDPHGSTIYRLKEFDMGGGLLISRDRGETWENVETPTSRLQSVAAHPHLEGAVYIYSQYEPHFFLSNDYGQNWEEMGYVEEFFRPNFYFDHDQGETVYIVTRDMALRKSVNSGKDWQPCEDTVQAISPTTTRFAIDPVDPEIVYLATSGDGVLTSRDGCQSWESRNQGLGNLYVSTIAVDYENPNTIYAGTDGGVYISFDSGEHWNQGNEGLLGANVIYSIAVDPTDSNNVYAATPYGIFKLESK